MYDLRRIKTHQFKSKLFVKCYIISTLKCAQKQLQITKTISKMCYYCYQKIWQYYTRLEYRVALLITYSFHWQMFRSAKISIILNPRTILRTLSTITAAVALLKPNLKKFKCHNQEVNTIVYLFNLYCRLALRQHTCYHRVLHCCQFI